MEFALPLLTLSTPLESFKYARGKDDAARTLIHTLSTGVLRITEPQGSQEDKEKKITNFINLSFMGNFINGVIIINTLQKLSLTKRNTTSKQLFLSNYDL